MKLNRLEWLVVNNPVRAALQWRYEAPLLERLGGRVAGGHVLEVGCGRGVGTQIIFERFAASRVHAFDLDPGMIRLARRRLGHISPDRLRLYVADATRIPEPDASFDAVFDFAIVHHVPRWEDAIAEVSRVLRPSGRFFFEEVTKHALDRWTYRRFFDHPKENRFGSGEFVAELERNGLRVQDRIIERFFGDFLLGVATKC